MNAEKINQLWALAATRHGLLTTSEIGAAVGRSGLQQLVRIGHLERVHRGVYRVAGAPLTKLQTVTAVALALEGVVAVRSAAALAGVDGFTLDKPEVLISDRTTRSRVFSDDLTVRVHYTNYLPAHHVEEVDGIRRTTLARTLCDISSIRSVETLGKIVDNCKRRRLVDYDEIAQCREEMRARGRRRTTVIDEVLAARIAGYQIGETPPEDTVIQWVQDAGFEPKAQHWTLANGKRRRIDVAVVDDKVAVEYQGRDGHELAVDIERDAEKITDLQLAGWFVVLVSRKTTKTKFIAELRRAVAIQRQARRNSSGFDTPNV
jgi:hypothetical protein